jgi:UDP-N-acetylglucosamine diphosphorylase/glucosamine-1-phosphate N-acetyltransferase
MNLILYDPPGLHTRFYPLTMSRPIAGIRIGILTLADKWEQVSGLKPSYLTVEYLRKKFPVHIETDNILINSTVIPDKHLFDSIASLKMNEALYLDSMPLAFRIPDSDHFSDIDNQDSNYFKKVPYNGTSDRLRRIADIFLLNGKQITKDLQVIQKIKRNRINDDHTIVYSEENIYVGKNTSIKAAILDAGSGPIFIGDNVTIQPGAIISGPTAILDGSVISMGAKIRSNTTIGPFSKIGGEVNNTVFQGYSNKSHDGFLGTSVIGEWCNFGAGSNNSNLKNNYGDIKVWDYAEEKMISTGLQYFGLIMGDHSKCGINTMYNTGTVAGFSANIYDGGYMPKFIPSFAWGNRNDFSTYELDKAIITARRVMERRSVTMTQEDAEIFERIFNFTSKHRLP